MHRIREVRVVPEPSLHHHFVLERQGLGVKGAGLAGALHERLARHLHAVRGAEHVEVDEVDGAVLAAEGEGEGEEEEDSGERGGELELWFLFLVLFEKREGGRRWKEVFEDLMMSNRANRVERALRAQQQQRVEVFGGTSKR